MPSPDHEQDISRKLEVPGGSNIVETHEYMFVLKLEDPTGSVDVVVRGDEAKLFLSQFQSPSDLEVNVAQRQMLQEKVGLLLSSRLPDDMYLFVKPCRLAPQTRADEYSYNPCPILLVWSVFDTISLPDQTQFDSLTRAPDEGGYSVPLMDCVIAKFLHAEEDGDDADDDPFDYLLVNTMLR